MIFLRFGKFNILIVFSILVLKFLLIKINLLLLLDNVILLYCCVSCNVLLIFKFGIFINFNFIGLLLINIFLFGCKVVKFVLYLIFIVFKFNSVFILKW